ncbi:MAG: hypothetical protein HYV92_00265 [Candidatus Rokubacteria bacterium]|nr:hypothetical protein [Candidatus Rokubacteria bacterium]MBI2544840.1 hypothetical protein [Candidatus Rokubacteria bacterium]MBI2552883.1 hypothetical protein [Candidatus Rokubacteria bacterium]
MTLTLTREEHEFLRETLKRYLADLDREIARTDSRTFKAQLKRDEEIARKLIERLSSASVTTDSA